MRIAVVSDSHGCLAALEAVVDDLDRQAVDEVLLGGDLAQGGRQPNEVLDLVRGRGWPSVLGNADLALVRMARGEPVDAPDIDERVVAGLRWTLERLRPEHVDYLAGLPHGLRRETPAGTFALVHANPWNVDDVVMPDAPLELAERVLAEADAPIVAHGHIHRAYQRRVGDRLLACVGNVAGSLLDDDPRPGYSIFTLEPGGVEVELRRVPFDRAAELEAMRQAGYPLRA